MNPAPQIEAHLLLGIIIIFGCIFEFLDFLAVIDSEKVAPIPGRKEIFQNRTTLLELFVGSAIWVRFYLEL